MVWAEVDVERRESAFFKDRREAGKYLAAKLAGFAYQPDVLVLALPRGGVPVGFEVAVGLELILDVFIVRKLGVPGYEELAMGAIASGDVRVLNEEVIQHLGISRDTVEAVVSEELDELRRREQLYRRGRQPARIAGQRVILVDDGLATGASMRAAVRALRQFSPESIHVAVPVSSKDTCDQLRSEADNIICGKTPELFRAVGQWYADFTQTTDQEVSGFLDKAAHLKKVDRLEAARRK